MRWHPKSKVLEISLADLEHCGFNHKDFEWELEIVGLERDLWPDLLVVRMAEGYAVPVDKDTKEPLISEELLEERRQANIRADLLVSRMLGSTAEDDLP